MVRTGLCRADAGMVGDSEFGGFYILLVSEEI